MVVAQSLVTFGEIKFLTDKNISLVAGEQSFFDEIGGVIPY